VHSCCNLEVPEMGLYRKELKDDVLGSCFRT